MSRQLHEMTLNDVTRFMDRVQRGAPNECWRWTRGKNKSGYGQLFVGGTMTSASRMAYAIANDYVPRSDEQVCHRCDNRLCCNPAHLFLGSLQDNMADRNAKGRQARGVRHATAKLDEAGVRAVRALRDEGLSLRGIAKRLGVSHCTALAVLQGKRWSDVA